MNIYIYMGLYVFYTILYIYIYTTYIESSVDIDSWMHLSISVAFVFGTIHMHYDDRTTVCHAKG